ncbi:hypothetical protein FVE85_6370 [Porphyridium purpureum]|uniref:Uncharacterized protein n=1 Tax=Porphyridium purpureum TaxID=35688 RepID=A0A5J4Z630_PORPP|nr:hypothetical protein FVE85_6370 [Porphyridium purpureum]|eukprot:POR5155..scf295_1
MEEAIGTLDRKLGHYAGRLQEIQDELTRLEGKHQAGTLSEYDCKVCAEHVTQVMEAVDVLSLRRSMAEDALRQGEEACAKKVCVLLVRRKRLLCDLNSCGVAADALATAARRSALAVA